MKKKLKAMLGSIRFWASVVIAVAYLLESSGLVPEAVARATQILAIFGITTRTIDKFR